MAQNLKHRVQLGLETTRGTVVTTTLELPILDDGFRPTLVNAQGEILSSSTFPYKSDSVPVGVTASLSLKTNVHRDNIRDLLLLATKRTAGVLPSVTMIDDQHGVGVARYAGCVCRQLSLGYSRSGTSDRSSILTAAMEFDCFSAANAAGALASLTQIEARKFQLRHGSVTVNNVAASDVLATAIAINNLLGLGPVNASNVRLYIEDGAESHSISHTARFSATTWRALVEGQTAAATNTIVLATGTANETVNFAIAAAQIGTRNLGEQDNVITEQIDVMPYYSGAAPVVITFGVAIGASVLGL